MHRPTFLSAIGKMVARLWRGVELVFGSSLHPHLFLPWSRIGVDVVFFGRKVFRQIKFEYRSHVRVHPDRQCLATEAGVFGRWVDRITKHESHGGDNIVR